MTLRNGRGPEPEQLTVAEILKQFEGRALDSDGVLLNEINSALFAYGHNVRVLRFLGGSAILSTPPETTSQPQDGVWNEGPPNESWKEGKQAREDAWLAKHPADTPLEKFARVWEGNSNSGTESLKGA